MERVRIADVNKGPYGSGRCLYQTLNKSDSTHTSTPIDLLQTLPGIEETIEEIPVVTMDTVISERDTTTEATGDSSIQSSTPQITQEQLHQRSCAMFDSQALPEENLYLCHRHARELENQTNNLYGHMGGNVYSFQEPASSTMLPQHKRTNTGDTIYCNKLFKGRQKSKDELRYSTQSLPAVTYNSKNDSNKTIWGKSGFLFRKNTRNKMGSSQANREGSNPHYSGNGNNSRALNMKRLLLITCLLVGIVLAVGGVAIGLLSSLHSKPSQGAECESEHVFCGEAGCISYTRACSSSSLHLCPAYVSALCSQSKTGNASSSPPVQTDAASYMDETQIYMHILFDDKGWARYTNSSNRESKYKVLDTVTTFSSAQQLCFRKGGHLVHITSLREQLFLEQFLRMQTEASSDTSDAFVPKGYWIGARRARGSHSGTCMMKQWRWLDANSRPFGDVTSFTAFAVGKPDNYHDPEECLFISTSDALGENSFLKWDDVPCDMPVIAQLLPLCEVEMRNH